MSIALDDLEAVARKYIQESPLNRVPALDGMRIFEAPLLAAAGAADPLFEGLKAAEAVGAHHLSPRQWLEGARTVIVYFLPFTGRVREANRPLGLPATEWLYGRIEGEQMNCSLSERLVQYLTACGYQAVAPGRDERFAVRDRRSNWSERHVAFIAGLGTFSLSRSLITRSGSAGRIGSVVTDLELPPTQRAYEALDEYCSRCGACIVRCPPLAIDEQGKDNAICGAYLDRVLARYRPRYGCGKCQTGVPCESKIPVTARRAGAAGE
ncbi:hypothetical protein EDC14_1003105 [Hydrogenispora ethanolica]|uniref:4Fe-4S ferredoxin-type domain-containing protein n=2 Tax=Hydrogenispora ethanolica TaxID=1082276 RepID=A0A4R1S7V1_HYDET|nr:epoxyqueuosine reductase [Hydrogenispora ethanolica]TCL75174.1 hypothetical protein EDC14_1003105 [Hydrogenispora ethanolica]